MLDENLEKLNKPAYRYKLYFVVALLYFILSIVIIQFKDNNDLIVSDATMYYDYIISIFIDKDLPTRYGTSSIDFTPEYYNSLPFQERLKIRPTSNPYPFGWAESILPAFLLTHGVMLLGDVIFSPEEKLATGLSFPYHLMVHILCMVYGYFVLILIDKFLVRLKLFDPKVIFLSICTFWIVSNYSYYFFRTPAMIHTVSAFWVTLFIYYVYIEITEPSEKYKNYIIMGISFFMAQICRGSNIFLVPLALVAAYIILKNGVNKRKLMLVGASLLAGIIITFPHFWVSKITWGKWFISNSYAYSGNSLEIPGFNWGSPNLLKTLFSPKHGLFYWTPLYLLSILGVFFSFIGSRIYRVFFISLLISALFLWYINSSWWVWWFGASFGNRAFLELALFWILTTAALFKYVQDSRKKLLKFGLISFVGLCAIYNYWLMFLFITKKIHRVKPLDLNIVFPFL